MIDELLLKYPDDSMLQSLTAVPKKIEPDDTMRA
jgi:hypothetical protein